MQNAKYKQVLSVGLPDRTWPDRAIKSHPIWCSVDLRDGNQALPRPMSVSEKVDFFEMLIKIGLKEIEVGFPSASETEFEFLRVLIREKMIPKDVTIQILTQSRPHLIERSFEAIDGAERAIVHLYNSTSPFQREVVFKKSKAEVIELALSGTSLIKKLSSQSGVQILFEYSPESFSATEIDFAVEICGAVVNEWNPLNGEKVIINLPATVETSTPNVYADRIEFFTRNFPRMDDIILSVHPHNDRGTAVAAAELALMAGARRVEGTLFGNGERTGNLDIITMALNMYSQGIDPGLYIKDLDAIQEVYERCTRMSVGARHPYAGELVYTAFSGSHQDAIKKGLEYRLNNNLSEWDIPYLPIDPADVGRRYETIIRINSQSGKGGVAYVMDSEYGYKLPKAMHSEFSGIVQEIADKSGRELDAKDILEVFQKEFTNIRSPFELVEYSIPGVEKENEPVNLHIKLAVKGEEVDFDCLGAGPVDALFNCLKLLSGGNLKLISYDQHALTSGSDSRAIAYIQLEKSGNKTFGVGISRSITTAPLRALVSAVNRLS